MAWRTISKFAALVVFVSVLVACESIDCTLNNVVCCNISFYKSGTDSLLTLSDTLTVTAVGTDSVLLNRGVEVSTMNLPLSYWRDADSLCLNVYGDEYEWDDYVVIEKSNVTHYESPDCPTTVFHEITGVKFNSPYGTIDSVVVTKRTVNYDTNENIRIYFNSSTTRR